MRPIFDYGAYEADLPPWWRLHHKVAFAADVARRAYFADSYLQSQFVEVVAVGDTHLSAYIHDGKVDPRRVATVSSHFSLFARPYLERIAGPSDGFDSTAYTLQSMWWALCAAATRTRQLSPSDAHVEANNALAYGYSVTCNLESRPFAEIEADWRMRDCLRGREGPSDLRDAFVAAWVVGEGSAACAMARAYMRDLARRRK